MCVLTQYQLRFSVIQTRTYIDWCTLLHARAIVQFLEVGALTRDILCHPAFAYSSWCDTPSCTTSGIKIIWSALYLTLTCSPPSSFPNSTLSFYCYALHVYSYEWGETKAKNTTRDERYAKANRIVKLMCPKCIFLCVCCPIHTLVKYCTMIHILALWSYFAYIFHLAATMGSHDIAEFIACLTNTVAWLLLHILLYSLHICPEEALAH